MKVVVEALDKKSQLLVSEIELKSSYVYEVSKVLGLSDDDLRFLLSGAGGFDINLKTPYVFHISMRTLVRDYMFNCCKPLRRQQSTIPIYKMTVGANFNITII